MRLAQPGSRRKAAGWQLSTYCIIGFACFEGFVTDALFRRQSLKAVAHNLRAFNHVDESVRVEETEVGFQLH